MTGQWIRPRDVSNSKAPPHVRYAELLKYGERLPENSYRRRYGRDRVQKTEKGDLYVYGYKVFDPFKYVDEDTFDHNLYIIGVTISRIKNKRIGMWTG